LQARGVDAGNSFIAIPERKGLEKLDVQRCHRAFFARRRQPELPSLVY
jgi:hypothetical protein